MNMLLKMVTEPGLLIKTTLDRRILTGHFIIRGNIYSSYEILDLLN
jgi:hypothetical protein